VFCSKKSSGTYGPKIPNQCNFQSHLVTGKLGTEFVYPKNYFLKKQLFNLKISKNNIPEAY
jgi:hypothetical protein